MKAYGVVNAYDVAKITTKEIVYERFYRICLPSYIISLITFVGVHWLFVLRLEKRKEMSALKTEKSYDTSRRFIRYGQI